MPAEEPESRSQLPSIGDADWLGWEETARVFRALSVDGVETRAVGGAVRNALLGLPISEVDLATTALPDTVMHLASEAGLKALPTGKEYGTITVLAGGKHFEVTTLRRDIETYGRHARVAFTEDWAEDARRRDFTMNALYADARGRVFDPLGGYDDLLARRVRFIGDPEARIEEDYLRILRFFRFHATFGARSLDPDGLRACVLLRDGLDTLSGERVAAELRRILVAAGAKEAIETLFDYGLLVLLLDGVPRLLDFERLLEIEAALGLPPNAMLRLAALAVSVEEDVDRLTARLKLSNAEQAVLSRGAQVCPIAAPDEKQARAMLYRLGLEAYRDVILLQWARCGAAADDAIWRRALGLPARWDVPIFPLRGSDLVARGLVGPAIGESLRQIERDWISGGFAQDRAELLLKADALAAASRGKANESF